MKEDEVAAEEAEVREVEEEAMKVTKKSILLLKSLLKRCIKQVTLRKNWG